MSQFCFLVKTKLSTKKLISFSLKHFVNIFFKFVDTGQISIFYMFNAQIPYRQSEIYLQHLSLSSVQQLHWQIAPYNTVLTYANKQ